MRRNKKKKKKQTIKKETNKQQQKQNTKIRTVHLWELCETALINCVFVLTISVCGIAVLICVCKDWLLGPNGPNATILEH